VLILVLIPVLVVVDSYRIVPDIQSLAREAPDRTAIMAERLANPRTPRPLRNRRVALGAVSPHLIHAVIVHEDATFFEHHGFDVFEIRAALQKSWAERQLGRGASTITTQLARCLYLGTERSLMRKAREIPLTLRLERTLPKRRILELYLNVVEWGPGIFGAESASRHHFGVSARDLSPVQAALLAAALPSPRRSTPARPSNYLRRRAGIILTRMEARSWLTPDDVAFGRTELGLPARPAAASLSGEEVGPEPEVEPWLEAEPGSELNPESEPHSESDSEPSSDLHAEATPGSGSQLRPWWNPQPPSDSLSPDSLRIPRVPELEPDSVPPLPSPPDSSPRVPPP
jgi:monofunctional biosynthetic peptidoglycan transglycosylase